VTHGTVPVHNSGVSQAPDPRTDLHRRVGRAWRQVRRGAGAIKIKDYFYGSGPDGLDLALADGLAVIAQQGPMRMGELAEALQITPASTTRAVSCLVTKGFAKREKAKDDHRSVVVSATSEGQARFEQFNDKIQAGLDEILSEFSRDELEDLAAYLDRFVMSVDRFVSRQSDTHAESTPDQ